MEPPPAVPRMTGAEFAAQAPPVANASKPLQRRTNSFGRGAKQRTAAALAQEEEQQRRSRLEAEQQQHRQQKEVIAAAQYGVDSLEPSPFPCPAHTRAIV